jgi:hypothetical protein
MCRWPDRLLLPDPLLPHRLITNRDSKLIEISDAEGAQDRVGTALPGMLSIEL